MEGLRNDPEPIGFVQSSYYEPISSHIDLLQIQFHDFHKKSLRDLVLNQVLNLVQNLVQGLVLDQDLVLGMVLGLGPAPRL